MKNSTNSSPTPEDILIALDQLSQTIEVMTGVISRLKYIVETPTTNTPVLTTLKTPTPITSNPPTADPLPITAPIPTKVH